MPWEKIAPLIDGKPLTLVIRLYSQLNMFIDALINDRVHTKYIEEINNLVSQLSRDDRGGDIIKKYFPVGLYLLEDKPKKGDLILYLHELASSIEKGIIDELEKHRSIEKVKYGQLRYIYPILTVPLIQLLEGYEYIPGSVEALISIPHCTPPMHDRYTLDIGMKIAGKTGSHIIYSKISRLYVDYNRSIARLTPYRRVISRVIREKNIRILLDIHGEAEGDVDIEIGYASGISAKRRTIDLLCRILGEHGLTYISEDSRFTGGDIIRYHSILGRNEAIQLEISKLVREERVELIADALAKFINSYLGGLNER